MIHDTLSRRSATKLCTAMRDKNAGTAKACEHGGDRSSRYEDILILNIFITKFPSLLIRFIITIDGKYKTS